MFARLALAAALTALTIVPSQAIEWMHRKAGLWSITMNVDGVNHMPGAMRMCLDAATDAKLMDHSMSFQPKDCDPAAMSGIGASHTIDLTCHMDGGVQKTHIVMNFAGDGAYHMDMLGHYTPAHYGRDSMHMTQDGKWMGPCPADFKPGDMEIGGMKINVLGGGPGAMPGMHGGHLTKEQIDAIIKAHQH